MRFGRLLDKGGNDHHIRQRVTRKSRTGQKNDAYSPVSRDKKRVGANRMTPRLATLTHTETCM